MNDGTIGIRDPNPILNTAVYNVQYLNGVVTQYEASIIAENLYVQVDMDGYISLILDSIVNHRKTDDALTKER